MHHDIHGAFFMTDGFRLSRSLSAVMIDGDNISPARADDILSRLERAGMPEIRRVYGNIALTKGWGTRPGFRTIHSGEGKNATDLLLAIETMDLLHQGRLGRLVLVSSDGDYTHLVHRLREEGVEVIGMGESKTPTTMREACSHFVELEALQKAEPSDPAMPPRAAPPVIALASAFGLRAAGRPAVKSRRATESESSGQSRFQCETQAQACAPAHDWGEAAGCGGAEGKSGRGHGDGSSAPDRRPAGHSGAAARPVDPSAAWHHPRPDRGVKLARLVHRPTAALSLRPQRRWVPHQSRQTLSLSAGPRPHNR